MAHAFAVGDGELLARSLDDRYAEPLRANLIPPKATCVRRSRKTFAGAAVMRG